MRRVLIAEDEDVIRDFIVINLKRSGYDVVDVADGEQALKVFEESGGDFDVVILDIMMPGIDGFGVCEKIRARSNNIGIIILSARSQEMDKVRGLMTGADDYITKPFSPSELVARVDAIYRRVSMAKESKLPADEIVSGPFTLNNKSHMVSKNGRAIDLTQVEFQILEFFMKNPDTAMERSAILQEVWGPNYYGDVKIVDVNIRRLRMKIEDDPSNPRYLQTVWGFGYKWSV